MPLEAATYIDDLVDTNPVTTDKRKQGDDHLRLIKEVLRATFPRASKPFYFPDAEAKSTNFVVASTEAERTFLANTGAGGISMTLPSLAAADEGWCCYLLKTTADAHPVFVVPPSGTVNGFTKVRRSVAHLLVTIFWTGSTYAVTRQFGVPIGSTIPNYATALPQGCLWPSGNNFSASDYVELTAALGSATTPDERGRAGFGRDDMGGAAAGRITNAKSGITGTGLGNVGGNEAAVLLQTYMENFTLPDNLSATVNNGTSVIRSSSLINNVQNTGGPNSGVPVNVASEEITVTINGNVTSGGGGNEFPKVPPAIIHNSALIAE